MIPDCQFHLERIVLRLGSFDAYRLDRPAIYEQGHLRPDAASHAAPGSHDDAVLPRHRDTNCLPDVAVTPKVPAARYRPAFGLDGGLLRLQHNLRQGQCFPAGDDKGKRQNARESPHVQFLLLRSMNRYSAPRC